MVMREIREVLLRWKHSYLKNKFDCLNYSTSITTSCAVPVIRIQRKIWMVESICFDTFHIEHQWFENEKHFKEYLFILDTTGCIYETKEYDIEL